MSIAAIAWSWKQDLRPTEKFILVSIADHANDEDFTCWPSLSHLERKTGYNRTTIWRTIDGLVKAGLITRAGEHPSGATLYKVMVGAQCTQVHTVTQVGAGCNVVGAHSNKVGAQDTRNHKNHHEPSLTIKISSKFVKPTIIEVSQYCKERGNTVSANRFLNYYDSNGWKIGRTPMKDWKAAIRTWEQREGENNGINQRDTRSRAKRFSDKLDDIARRDIEKNGLPDKLD